MICLAVLTLIHACDGRTDGRDCAIYIYIRAIEYMLSLVKYKKSQRTQGFLRATAQPPIEH